VIQLCSMNSIIYCNGWLLQNHYLFSFATKKSTLNSFGALVIVGSSNKTSKLHHNDLEVRMRKDELPQKLNED